MRQQERLAYLLGLVADVGEILAQVTRNVVEPEDVEVAELRLEAAIAATGFDLPACRALIGTSITHHN